MTSPEINPEGHKFRTTRWSLVLKTRGKGEKAARALEGLCQTYWFPLYAWCRRHGLSSADAEDMVQGFFVQVLEKRLFDNAEASRGKLRTFLLTALQRHVRDEMSKSQAQRRGGGKVISFDVVEAEQWYTVEQREGESAEHLFDRQWALTVLNQAVALLEMRAKAEGKEDLFEALRPFLTREGSGADYEQAGSAIGMKPATFKVAVHRLRAKFREALRAEVADTKPDESSIDEEIRYLMAVLNDF